jgi:hypothetical protein
MVPSRDAAIDGEFLCRRIIARMKPNRKRRCVEHK